MILIFQSLPCRQAGLLLSIFKLIKPASQRANFPVLLVVYTRYFYCQIHKKFWGVSRSVNTPHFRAPQPFFCPSAQGRPGTACFRAPPSYRFSSKAALLS